jgi:hypothetical protein
VKGRPPISIAGAVQRLPSPQRGRLARKRRKHWTLARLVLCLVLLREKYKNRLWKFWEKLPHQSTAVDHAHNSIESDGASSVDSEVVTQTVGDRLESGHTRRTRPGQATRRGARDRAGRRRRTHAGLVSRRCVARDVDHQLHRRDPCWAPAVSGSERHIKCVIQCRRKLDIAFGHSSG